ncbi:MAG: type II toxin-antitoxin system VapC family toxin [Chloroflexota bacterium]|nr:type II toxin-antitoxin system VapC family toxin [Chloroflexota bacterium]
MIYLIDTDWFIDYLFRILAALDLIDPLIPSGIAISTITYMEAYQGILRAVDRQRAELALAAVLRSAPVLPFSSAEARRCAALREDLRRQGKRMRPRALDLLIAATALEHNLTLVTRNRDDYENIPGLILHS